MGFEATLLRGLTEEQQDRYLETMAAISDQIVDCIHRGESRIYSVMVCEGRISACIGLDYAAEEPQHEALTTWSADAAIGLQSKYTSEPDDAVG